MSSHHGHPQPGGSKAHGPQLRAVATVRTGSGPNNHVVSKTYSNSKYNVTVHPDGAIHVKPGDWLSKYSAAMHNDFARIHEFGRKDASGKLRPIHNPNLLRAGETIYHIPTYKRANPLRMDAIELNASPLTEEQQKKLILETLKKDVNLPAELWKLVEHGIHVVHGLGTAGTILEIIGLIAEGSAAATIVTALELANAVLTPVLVGGGILHAQDTDRRIVGAQASCYALTAWAYGDTIPSFPSSLRRNFTQTHGEQIIPREQQAWDEAAQKMVKRLEGEVMKRRAVSAAGFQKESYQVFLQTLGGSDRASLARRCLELQAEGRWGSERRAVLGGLDPEKYPN